MNDIQHLPENKRLFEAAPSMRSASPSLRRALADRDYSPGGRGPWDPEWALDLAARNGDEEHLDVARRDLEAAMLPASPQWYGKRLPVLWTLFMATRDADPRALTVWMAETAHLLSDLPHDIVAHSIDRAIQTAKHGFMPAVGEIRTIAEPLVAEREMHIQRLIRMGSARADPVATAARAQRREEQARNLPPSAKGDAA